MNAPCSHVTAMALLKLPNLIETILGQVAIEQRPDITVHLAATTLELFTRMTGADPMLIHLAKPLLAAVLENLEASNGANAQSTASDTQLRAE